jgi:flagellar biosynthetic protein FliS
MPKPHAQDIAAHYRDIQIKTASTSKAVCMLHEKGANFLRQALDIGEADKKRYVLDRAQNIFAQLQHSLRGRDQISQSLLLLYDYCYARCESLNSEEIRRALDIFDPLKETFLYLKKHP